MINSQNADQAPDVFAAGSDQDGIGASATNSDSLALVSDVQNNQISSVDNQDPCTAAADSQNPGEFERRDRHKPICIQKISPMSPHQRKTLGTATVNDRLCPGTRNLPVCPGPDETDILIEPITHLITLNFASSE